jgi:hypothetical protein
MTTIRLLSAGLVATAMFIAPAMARQHHVTPRHQSEDIDPGAPEVASSIYGTYCIPAPRVGAFATQPWDNRAPPCEPAYGYGYGYGY